MPRPVNLKLTAFRFPISAIVSILHRISGVVLLLGVGYLSYLLSLTLESESSFNWVMQAATSSWHGFVIWAVLSSLMYHMLAGVRHLLIDLHVGDSLAVSQKTSLVVLGLTVLGSLYLGIWLIT